MKREGKIPHTVAFKITTLQENQRKFFDLEAECIHSSKTARYPVYLFPSLQQLKCTIFLHILKIYDYSLLACEEEYNCLSFKAGVTQVCIHELACSKQAHINKKISTRYKPQYKGTYTDIILAYLSLLMDYLHLENAIFKNMHECTIFSVSSSLCFYI